MKNLADMKKQKTIRVTCRGAATLPLSKLLPFPGIKISRQ
jgi:hypothetical protein